MKTHTFIWVVIAIIAILLGGWILFAQDDGAPPEEILGIQEGLFMMGDEEWMRVVDKEFGVSFAYRESPDGWTLLPETTIDEGKQRAKVYTLLLKRDYEDLRGSTEPREGPPGIIVEIYENQENMDARTWIETYLRSNYMPGSPATETSLGGKDAIRYSWDGLYSADAVAAAIPPYVYVFSGTYISKDLPHQKDFADFLTEVRFLREGKIGSFEECAAAGNPVMESYPRQCKTPDGRSFTEAIGNELEKVNFIRIKHPRPNEIITSPLEISGEARGYWFFEASFPVVLVDWDGKIIAQHYAQADGEWMTEDFVPFTSELVFENPSFPSTDAGHFSKRGALILQKDNPSGLPEHDDALEIPIQFE